RAMVNDLGERLEEAGPATPVEVTGFNEVPEAGDVFQVSESESEARSIASYRQQEQRRRELSPTAGRMSLEQLYDKIEQGEVKELPVVLKADVQGSVEVLRDALQKLSTDQVRVNVIHAQVGAISTNDVILATASEAIVVGFNVRPERNASELAEKEGIEIRLYTVIYELTDEVRAAMAGLLEPVFKEVISGHAEVRETFKVPKAGLIAGCHVTDGVVHRNSLARLLRDNVVVYDGKVSSLRRFKDDASEVRAGFECGIGLDRYQDLKPGDVIEAYAKEEVAAEL
ncbi:MAG TPA: translation initiation factor IF-2, partial [Thermoanaerobaculia bacterium]|nr:translation initiation factor IF-2 [Thermoanaerobaculia bacterium]